MNWYTQKEVIGDCTIYLADSRQMPPMAADMVLTDAPYLIESGGPQGLMGGKFDPSVYANDGKIVECAITWKEVWQVIANGVAQSERAHIYCMANNRNVNEAWNEALGQGFHFHNLLAWDKGTLTPNRWYMKNLEYLLMFKKGPAFPINDCGQSQLIRFQPTKETSHPTEKPIELMANYIRQSSQVGQLVLDPFAGTGATVIAAAKEGRKAVGVEIDKDHFYTMCERLETIFVSRQERLFA